MESAEHRLRRWLCENQIRLPLDEDGDEQDLENLEILKVTQRGIDFVCGGDWQSAMWLLLKPDKTIEVVQKDTYTGQFSNWEMEDFLYQLDKLES